jgi:hypothetical protein
MMVQSRRSSLVPVRALPCCDLYSQDSFYLYPDHFFFGVVAPHDTQMVQVCHTRYFLLDSGVNRQRLSLDRAIHLCAEATNQHSSTYRALAFHGWIFLSRPDCSSIELCLSICPAIFVDNDISFSTIRALEHHSLFFRHHILSSPYYG